jgi:cytochrome c biogenesis protein CcmG/thiol:disulfide interchange protein DsbE
VVAALVLCVVGGAGLVVGAVRDGAGSAHGAAVPNTVDDPATASPGPAPALAGRTLAGGTLDLADLRGSVVLVNVWAAWCAPCRAELPVLARAGQQLGNRGLHVVGIDARDGERQARELLARTGGDPASSIVDPDGAHARTWGVRGVPEAFVVDTGGRVRARYVGAVTRQWIDRYVVPLLPSPGPPG